MPVHTHTHTRTITTADTASPLPSLIFQAWSHGASWVKYSRRRPNPPQATVKQNGEGEIIWRWTKDTWTKMIRHWKRIFNHSCAFTAWHTHNLHSLVLLVVLGAAGFGHEAFGELLQVAWIFALDLGFLPEEILQVLEELNSHIRLLLQTFLLLH